MLLYIVTITRIANELYSDALAPFVAMALCEYIAMQVVFPIRVGRVIMSDPVTSRLQASPPSVVDPWSGILHLDTRE